MSKRWSLNEDIIVCKYCIENPWAYRSEDDVETMVSKLEEAGFEVRSRSAVLKRAYAYEILLENRLLPSIPRQIIMVYGMMSSDRAERFQEVKSYIREVYKPNENTEIIDESDELLNLTEKNNDLHDFKHTIEYHQTFPMVLQKYIDLKMIKKHSSMCRRIGMKPDTFSAILRGKYKEVKKENVLRLCIGLELNVEQAGELLNSAGFVLSDSLMTDVVIKYCLMSREYNVVIINSELYENKAPMLFQDYQIEYDVI